MTPGAVWAAPSPSGARGGLICIFEGGEGTRIANRQLPAHALTRMAARPFSDSDGGCLGQGTRAGREALMRVQGTLVPRRDAFTTDQLRLIGP